MRHTFHESNNAVLADLPGLDAELHVTKTHDQNGNEIVLSLWEPNDEERAAIARGAKIVFMCWGHTHPPVAIGVEALRKPSDYLTPHMVKH